MEVFFIHHQNESHVGISVLCLKSVKRKRLYSFLNPCDRNFASTNLSGLSLIPLSSINLGILPKNIHYLFTTRTGIFVSLWITPKVTLPRSTAFNALLPWDPITIRSTFDFSASFMISSTGCPDLITIFD